MVRGVDSTFLIQLEVAEHAGHAQAQSKQSSLLAAGDTFALAPQVLTEFVHIVTDPRRFVAPLAIDQAVSRASDWWQAAEVAQVLPGGSTVDLFVQWMAQHQLGRKRILDTMLAATYFSNGISSIITTNARDFAVFGCFDVVTP